MKKIWIPSPFCKPRGSSPLNIVVIHHIGSKNGKLYSLNGTITWFTSEEAHKNKETGRLENLVSAHYIIPRTPYEKNDLIQLVGEDNIAYHAGESQWVVDGKTLRYLNRYSIGIELEGDGNLIEYTDHQYESLSLLLREIIQQNGIKVENIVGHEDVSPGRKVDPGRLFDWMRLRKSITPAEMIVMPAMEVTASNQGQVVSDIERVPDSEFFMKSGADNQGILSRVISGLIKLLLIFIKR